MTLGLDCAKTMERNAGNEDRVRKLESAEKTHQRKLADARKTRKAEANRAAYRAELARCEALAAASEGFARGFANSVADQIKRGKAPSAKQMALLTKLEDEVAG